MATAAPKQKVHFGGLARMLVRNGILPEDKVREAAQNAQKEKLHFVSYLIQKKIMAPDKLADASSQEFGIPLFNINALDLESAHTNLVNEKLIRKHNALPLFKRGNRVFVAISDPTNMQGLDEIKFNLGVNTEAILVEEDKLAKVIEKVLEAQDTTLAALEDADLDDIDITSGDEEPQEEEGGSEIDNTPVVRFVNKVLLDAINKGASDIHFEPYEKIYRVRYRIDGILSEVAAPPINLAGRISARIKVMSSLDISERRVPQDGRMKMRLSKTRAIDFRVSTCPTLFGEKVVMRILDPTSAQMGIDALGYEKDQKKLFMDAIHKPYGMVLVTGPTGSGKTVSLYTALNILNTTERNISTAEDPVEINLPGINQVNVREAVGMTFPAALKAFLRQDPDIIMVGEIRDLETGNIAIKAAQTGHMVLSTLHTNDCPQTITRLSNMGIPLFNIASALSLIIAQRLARRLCKKCKAPADTPKATLLEEGFSEEQIENGEFFIAVGCDQCHHGYKGRVGIYQVMPISEVMGRMIMEGKNAYELADQAQKEGINDLRQSSLQKVVQGLTSLEEINRVTVE